MLRKLKNIAHLFEAVLANLFYGFPARKLTVIGVTGTDGKTTTASLIHHILSSNGHKTSMITTVGAKIIDTDYDTGFHTTTPSAFSLQKYIKKAVNAKSEYLILETTSHALDQNRTFGIPFSIGVLTNVTHEHLDYHKTYENYLKTKIKLLKKSKIGILNMDDGSYSKAQQLLLGKKTISYSKESISANFNESLFEQSKDLLDDVNASNYLAAFSVCKALGVGTKEILSSFATFKLPVGRQEVVYDKNFKVIIDFAHTPGAFEKILFDVKKSTKGRLVHVFGAAGKRDSTKRKLMGKISSQYSDLIILTAEDPRGESVIKINGEIEKGINKKFIRINSGVIPTKQSHLNLLFDIPDRKEAIEFAILSAKKGDTVLITGKGHEKSMNLGKGEIPWSDHEAVKNALKKTN